MTSHDGTTPRPADSATDLVVDCFAGPGGWDQGLRLAGHRGALVGLEHDLSACRTAVAAGHARICADVATYPTAPFGGRVDGLIQSPPCQGWSNAGDRKGELDRAAVHARLVAFAQGREPALVQWHDERSPLAAEPMRWAYALRPRWIALEQVPPVLPLWEHMAVLLRGMGYRVWTGILSAEEYGVPQTRKRAILVARRDGQPVGPPTPTHQPYRSGVAYETESSLFGDPLPCPVSMADALGWGLPDQPSSVVKTARGRQAGPEDALRGSSWRHAWFQRQIADGNWVMRSNYGNNGDAQDRGERDSTEPAPTVTGKVNRNKVVLRGGQPVGGDSAQRTERTEDEPAQTVMSTVNRSMWTFRNGPQNNATDRNMDDPAGTVYGSWPGNLNWVMRNGNQANACARARALDEPWTSPGRALDEPWTSPGRALDEPAGTLFFGQRTNAVDWVVCPWQQLARRQGQDVAVTTGMSQPPSTGLTSNVGSWRRVHGPAGKECGEARTDEQSVRVTVQEAGVLQSFPADYPWQGTKSAQYRQVGDAIPPLLAAAILRPLLRRGGS